MFYALALAVLAASSQSVPPTFVGSIETPVDLVRPDLLVERLPAAPDTARHGDRCRILWPEEHVAFEADGMLRAVQGVVVLMSPETYAMLDVGHYDEHVNAFDEPTALALYDGYDAPAQHYGMRVVTDWATGSVLALVVDFEYDRIKRSVTLFAQSVD